MKLRIRVMFEIVRISAVVTLQNDYGEKEKENRLKERQYLWNNGTLIRYFIPSSLVVINIAHSRIIQCLCVHTLRQ